MKVKTVFRTLALVGMVICFIAGCTFFRDERRAEKDQPVDFYQSDGRYYYYIESQLQQKKGHLDQAIDFLKKKIGIGNQIWLDYFIIYDNYSNAITINNTKQVSTIASNNPSPHSFFPKPKRTDAPPTNINDCLCRTLS